MMEGNVDTPKLVYSEKNPKGIRKELVLLETVSSTCADARTSQQFTN
jgi:hypothetical protein